MQSLLPKHATGSELIEEPAGAEGAIKHTNYYYMSIDSKHDAHYHL